MAVISAAIAVRTLLDPLLGDQLPFVTMFGAIALAVWFGGWGAGLFAAVVGFTAANYWFVSPRGAINVTNVFFWVGLGGFSVSSGIIIGFGEALRRATAAARSRAALLESEMEQRASAQEALLSQQRQYATLVANLPDVVFELDGDLRHRFISPSVEKIAGIPAVRYIGKTGREIGLPPEACDAFEEACRIAVTTRTQRTVEFADRGRVFRSRVIPQRSDNGDVTVLGITEDITERKRTDEVLAENQRQREALYRFANQLQQSETLDEIYAAALEAITTALQCDAASILLFDADHAMRFVAARGLSDEYRAAVEGHSPWAIDTANPEPIYIADEAVAELPDEVRTALNVEKIRALAFIPLISKAQVTGKFMTYFTAPREFVAAERDTALTIARQLAFAIARRRAEDALRESEGRLRLAVQTGRVGAWEWDIPANRVTWSDSLYAMHGITPAQFPATMHSYADFIHPDDRAMVWQAVLKALRRGAAYDVTFRALKPDGEIVWLFTNAVVLRAGHVATRMVGATTDITKVKQAEEAMARAKLEAEQANRAKDEFIAMLSHELRTPLTPVLIAASALEADPETSEFVREQLAMIRRNIGLEARLIDDLLDISRIAHGKLELHEETLDVHVALEHALRISISDLHARKQHLVKQLDAKQHHVRADAARMEEVFWNLIKNAVKYTPDGGTITVATRNEGPNRIVVEVRDTGAGIEAALQPRIFDAFDQGGRAMQGSYGGLGLGLAISKRIVEMHSGKIDVQSAGKEQGSTFSVTLTTVEHAHTASVEPPLTNGAIDRLARILIVEDHEDTARVIGRVLEHAGYTVQVCRSVAEGRATSDAQTFDLLISDIGLPDGTGIDLMRHIRAANPRVPAIALSGFGTADDIEASRAAGFTLHLTKPIDLERLRGAIRELLQLQHAAAASSDGELGSLSRDEPVSSSAARSA